MKRRAQGFTLIEMLIVIVIIGILAGSLIPRLQGMQGSARDAARKADLNQIGTAISAYFSSYGEYPLTGAHDVADMSDALRQYLPSLPSDPLSNQVVTGIPDVGSAGTPGQYRFTTVSKNGRPHAGFVLMATMETYGASSNYVVTSTTGAINTETDFFNISLCSTVRDNVYSASTPCQTTDGGQLRYIYKN